MNTIHARSCELCGAAARVRVLRRYNGATPDIRSYCIDCADNFSANEQAGGGIRAVTLVSASGLVLSAGAAYALLSQMDSFADIDRFMSLAPWSSLVLWLGCLLIFLGAWFRFDRDAFTLSAFAALAVLVDTMGTAGVNDARGWKHDLGLAIGLAFTVGVLVVYRRLSRQRDAAPVPQRALGLDSGVSRDGYITGNTTALSHAGG